VNTQQSDLPGYEEIIANPAAKLEGLSTVHSGLGDAAESLVLVHHEIDETKRRIESLALSTQSMVEEVQRLQPSELAATLDASLVSFSRESSESLGAMSQRVLTVASEIAASRNRVDEGFASLERQVTAQHDAISQGVANIKRQQGELERQQVELAQHISSVSKSIGEIRHVVDTTNVTSSKIQQVAEKMEPALQASFRAARNDIAAEMAQLRRTQLVSLILIVIAIALAWASLSGLIPGA
jgi:predicted  nucleic acid-binding Zn-ribbon protein